MSPLRYRRHRFPPDGSWRNKCHRIFRGFPQDPRQPAIFAIEAAALGIINRFVDACGSERGKKLRRPEQ